ncbi:hypothetical protein D3C85_1116300 [compost metagenome]
MTLREDHKVFHGLLRLAVAIRRVLKKAADPADTYPDPLSLILETLGKLLQQAEPFLAVLGFILQGSNNDNIPFYITELGNLSFITNLLIDLFEDIRRHHFCPQNSNPEIRTA